jgi:hypothetical protein
MLIRNSQKRKIKNFHKSDVEYDYKAKDSFQLE